jgi:hypothetical protein
MWPLAALLLSVACDPVVPHDAIIGVDSHFEPEDIEIVAASDEWSEATSAHVKLQLVIVDDPCGAAVRASQ